MSQPPRIFAGGMAHGRNNERFPVTDDEIRQVFGRFGEIVYIKTGSKDFVFIDYKDIESCQRAIKAMHNVPFDDHSTGGMKVQLADPSRDPSSRAPAGYRRHDRDRERDVMRRDDRYSDPMRRRSRSPAGRGGGGYAPDMRRPRSRSPRGEPLPPGNPPYRDRSRDRMDTRDRMPDPRAPGGGAGGFRDDQMRGDRGDVRSDRGDVGRDAFRDPRPDLRPRHVDNAGYDRPAMPDSRVALAYSPRSDGRARDRMEPGGARGGGYRDEPRAAAQYNDAGDSRYDTHMQGAQVYGGRGDARDGDVRREESRYPPARDEMRGDPRGDEYARRPAYDTRRPSDRQDPYPPTDAGRGGGYTGDKSYDAARGGEGSYARGYEADRLPRHREAGAAAYSPRTTRDRSRSGERPRAALGAPVDRYEAGYDDRGSSRGIPRDMHRAPPPSDPNRNRDYYAPQQSTSAPAGGREGYMNEYPPRGGTDGGYSRRDDYPRREGGGVREYDAARPDDGRGYGGARGDYAQGRGMESGRVDSQSQSHGHDMDYRAEGKPYAHSRGVAYDEHDAWSRGAGGRAPQERVDRRAASPPRTVRVDTDDGRGSRQTYDNSYASHHSHPPHAAGSAHGAVSGVGGAREVDLLPPTDLRRSLVRDGAGSASGSWSGSQTGAGSAPEAAAPETAAPAPAPGAELDKSENLSQVEALRRRQRAERFSAHPPGQEGGGISSQGQGADDSKEGALGSHVPAGGVQGDDDEGNM